MKVLQVIPNIETTNKNVVVGGAVNSMLRMSKELPRHVDVKVYTNTSQVFGGYDREINGNRVIAEYNPFRRGSITYSLYFLLTVLQKVLFENENVDIVHVHSGFPEYTLTSVALKVLTNKHIFHTLYCPVEVKSRLYERVISVALKLSSDTVDGLLAMSENVRESLEEKGVGDNIVTSLPPDFDTKKFTPRNESERIKKITKGPSEYTIVLFVGNTKADKGIDILIESVSSLKKDVKLVYTTELKNKGRKDRKKMIENRLDEGGLSDIATHFGIIDFMPELLASCDILVLPFRTTDGPSDYPVVLLEAMASGTAVVATSVGGIPELIDHGVDGLLVNPNENELTKAVSKLVDNTELRRSLGHAAREKAKSFESQSSPATVVGNAYSNVMK